MRLVSRSIAFERKSETLDIYNPLLAEKGNKGTTIALTVYYYNPLLTFYQIKIKTLYCCAFF